MDYRPDLPAPSGRDGAPKAKVAGLDAQNLKDKFTDKQHSGTGSSTDAGAPSDKDLDVGKRFMPEGGMRSQNVRDTTGNKPKEA